MPQTMLIDSGLLAELTAIHDRLRDSGCHVVSNVTMYGMKDAHFSTRLSLHDQVTCGIYENHAAMAAVREILVQLNNRPANYGGRFIRPWTGPGTESEERVALRTLLLCAMKWSNANHNNNDQLTITPDGQVVWKE